MKVRLVTALIRNRAWFVLGMATSVFAAPAHAQTIQADPGRIELGVVAAGAAYSKTTQIRLMGSEAVTVTSAVIMNYTGTIASVSPTSFVVKSYDGVTVTVKGNTPGFGGTFRDVVRFHYELADGRTSQTDLEVVGEVPGGGGGGGGGSTCGAAVAPDPYPFVGVIPHGDSCPDGSPMITMHMDNEDGDKDWGLLPPFPTGDAKNANGRSGWIGATKSNENTSLRFCRVDGLQFKPLSAADDVRNHYAVVQLGATCPAGSTSGYRVFLNEDDDNRNYITSSSGQERDYRPNYSDRCRHQARLNFCLFTAGPVTMSEFPELGVPYGVFAAEDFNRALNVGWVFMDDEDGANDYGQTLFSGNASAKRFITPLPDHNGDEFNTRLRMARVTGCVDQYEELVVIKNNVWHAVDLPTGRRASMPCVDWSNPEAMASTLDHIYTVQGDNMWKTYAPTGATSSLGAGWSGTEAMAALDGLVFTVQGGQIWRTRGSDGHTFSLTPGGGWEGTEALAAGWAHDPVDSSHHSYVFGVQGGVIWKTRAGTGATVALGSPGWWGTEAMTFGNGHLFIVHGDKLWKVHATTGATSVVEGSGWTGTQGMTFGTDGYIYAVQGDQLWRTHPNGGSISLGANWAGTQGMTVVR